MCSEETSCITKTLNCPHARGEHDETCGYAAPSAGADCGYVCDKCPQEGKADPQGEQPQEPSGETPVCTCTERCEAGAANAQCPVCAADPAACGVTDVQEPQEQTCAKKEGCVDGKHDPECPLYVAPACGGMEGCADGKHNPACPLYAAPTCSNLEGCVDDQHNPACPLYAASTCSNLEGCADGKHNPACPLYVAEEPAELADEGLTGPCGDNATYALTPNDEAASTYTLTISGTGATYDYDNNAPWMDKKDAITNLVIAPGITYLGNTLFNEMRNLKVDIVLPDTVTSIGTNLFRKSGITSLNLNRVTDLPQNAVAYACPNLTSVNLGAVTTISGNNNFRECPNLSSVQADNLVRDTAMERGNNFYGNTKLSVARFPQLKEIGYGMFNGTSTHSTNTHSIIFDQPLTTVGSYPFAEQTVYVVDAESAAKIYAVSGTNKVICAVSNGGTFAPDTTFEAGKLATPTKAGYGFGGWYASADFSGDAVTQPESGNTYYAKWESLSGSCGEHATYALTPNGDATYTLTISGTGAMTNYANANMLPWKNQLSAISKIVIESGITSVGDFAFIGAINATTVQLPEGLERIGQRGFANCRKLQSPVFPSTLKEIGENPFNECNAFDKIVLPDSLETTGNMLFRYCKSLSSINIPANMTALPEEFVIGCENLTSIQIPATVTSIGKSAFAKTGLTEVTLPATLTTLGASLFSECNSLKKVTINTSAKISSATFNICSALDTIIFTADDFDLHVESSNYLFGGVADQCAIILTGANPSSDSITKIGKNISADKDVVTLVPNGGVINGTAWTDSLATPTKDGHVFLGWYDNKDFSGAPVTKPESGNTYYAKWLESTALSVTLPDGTVLSLNVPKDGTVADVKQSIQQELWLAPDQQTLTFGEQTLEDSKTLTECGIENGSTLSLSISGQFNMANYSDIRMSIYPDKVELLNPISSETKSFPYTGAFTFTGNHNENIFFYGGSYQVTLDNYNCTLRDTYAGSCLELREGAHVTVMLKGNNKLVGSWEGSAIRVPEGTSVTIGGEGSLDASYQKGHNAAYGAAIGGENNNNFGTIRITGGTVTAYGVKDYCIGGGSNYNISSGTQRTGTIHITGGTVIAKSIGNQDGNPGAVVNITGGTVHCDSIIADTTGVTALVYDTSGKNPTVYGHVTLDKDYTLPAGETLTIQPGATLTIPKGVTLNVTEGTLTNNGILENYGTILGNASGTIQKPSALKLTLTDQNGKTITEAVYGDTVTISASIAEQATTRAVVTNKMVFYLGNVLLGEVEVTNGSAQLELSLSGDNWTPGEKTITVKFTGSDSLTKATADILLTVKKAAQTATPVLGTDFTVDYANERLSAEDSVEIWTAKDGGKQLTAPVSLTEHLGKTLYARFKETDTHLASNWTDVSIAQRPAAPTGVTGGRATLNGVKDTMEYSLDGKNFTKVPAGAGKVENLTAGIYQVRIAATATAPASSAVQATVYDRTGSLTTTQTNGSVTTETTLRDDGTSTVVTTEKRPDGTVSALLENKDKNGKVTSSQQTITNPDGSKLVIQLPEDGSKVVTQYDKNGKVIQQTTYPDKNKPAYIITGFAPKIVEGNGRSFWGWSLSLRTDDALCNFQDVLVQGLSLNPSNYEVSEKNGTTQIILKRGYLAKLPAGTYKIGIVSTNGTAWGTFVIPAKGEGWNPGTGDYIFFTGATLLLSAAALTLLLLRKKRRQ